MMRIVASAALLASLTIGCTGITGGGSTEICEQAAAHLEQCTGRKAKTSAASCDPVRAQEILATDCAGRSAQAWYDDLCAFGFIDCNNFGGWTDPFGTGTGTGTGVGTGSCAGQCNSQNDMGGCYCNADCLTYGDCCADYTSACGGGAVNPNPVNPNPGTGTCAGNCNGGDMGGCYCSPDCVQFGDCCADYATSCGGANPANPAPGNGSCAGKCNAGDVGGCYCNPDCLQFGDCCADYQTACP